MARKSSIKPTFDENVVDIVHNREFSELLATNMERYSFKVIEDRALPDARDGLKPSQRRILVAMDDLKLRPGGRHMKCAKICGDTSGNYHPHGEGVIYPTLVRMAQGWAARYPLIHPQGNFGDLDGESPAAMRYTEARLESAGNQMVGNGDLSPVLVPYISNYNDTMEEPTVLPNILPNLLINGASGIAVSVATNMPPHNLREVVNVIKAYIENPNITVDDVIRIMPGPDFPTPCSLLGQSAVKSYYETGRGTLKLEGKAEIEAQGTGTIIRVTKLPYSGTPKRFCSQVKDLTISKVIDGIVRQQNLSKDDNGKPVINIVLEIAKGANPSVIMNLLLKHTCLRETFSVNANVLIDGFKVEEGVPILRLVQVFVDHRKAVLTNQYAAELGKREQKLH